MKSFILEFFLSVTKKNDLGIIVIDEPLQEPKLDTKLSSIPEIRLRPNYDNYLQWRENQKLTNVYGEKNHDALMLKF